MNNWSREGMEWNSILFWVEFRFVKIYIGYDFFGFGGLCDVYFIYLVVDIIGDGDMGIWGRGVGIIWMMDMGD